MLRNWFINWKRTNLILVSFVAGYLGVASMTKPNITVDPVPEVVPQVFEAPRVQTHLTDCASTYNARRKYMRNQTPKNWSAWAKAEKHCPITKGK